MKVREFSKWVAANEELVTAGQASGEGRIKDTEKKMGKIIPGPLRELYRLHDGVEMAHGYVPPLQGDSSLPEMLGIITEADLGWDLEVWLPFFSYQTGDYDAVEVKSPKGRVCRLDPKTGEYSEIAPTFDEWLDIAVRTTKEVEGSGAEAEDEG
jgi:hypothetical protein